MSETPHERQQWGSQLQFLMACISYAVGLGNIWRFPSLAYENGGGAFLIPYLIVSFSFGFPLLYLELMLGQYARAGPAVIHGRIKPVLQGIGWGMILMSVLVSIYYNVVVAWAILYLFILVTGRFSWWSTCAQDFNTPYCYSSLEDNRCTSLLNHGNNGSVIGFFFNGSCFDKSVSADVFDLRSTLFSEKGAVSPAEEFFENYVLEKSDSMEDIGGLNWKITICYAVAWGITAFALRKGVKLVGKLAYFTCTVPYVIIAILFFRSITLEGASLGLDYFFFKPDLSYVFKPTTLRNAASHICYSLSVGFGGILSMASYNPPDHNPFSTAAIITVADAVMSVFGGFSVFSVLGFMAVQLNLPISEVVQSGTGLAFVAYPEAMSRLPLPWLWSFLFFIMIWILGVSTQFGFAESICTAIYDQFPATRRHRAPVVYAVCFGLFCCGLIICTKAGIFFFNVFNDYTASFALMVMLFLELSLVCHIYGIRHILEDIRSMLGPPKNKISRIFGPSGYYIGFIWTIFAPIVCAVMFVFSLTTQITYNMTYGKGARLYTFPNWSTAFGWMLSVIPLFFLPGFVFYNLRKFKQKGQDWKELFRLQPKWPSFDRHKEAGTGGTNTFYKTRVVPISDPNFSKHVNGGFNDGFNDDGSQQTKV